MDQDFKERRRLAIREEHRSWLRMIVEQALYGMVIGALFGWLMIHHNVHRFGEMIAKSPDGIGYAALLMFGFASLFGMVASGVAIWLRAEAEARRN